MARMLAMTANRRFFITVALALLAAFAILSLDLQRESLWIDEGWSAWAVYDDAPPDSLREVVSYVPNSLLATLIRVRADVHPPLYFLLLDLWVMVAGESVYALRLLSALFGLLALAGIYAVGTSLFDRPTGWIAIVILSTASFFIYYAREARMYSLLVALSTLTIWCYHHWARRPTTRRGLVYALALAALVYTHYYGVFVIAAQAIHLLMTRPVRWRMMPLPFVLALALYLPWLPVLLRQIEANPAGPLAAGSAADGGSLAWLIFILTGGHWGFYVAPFLPGGTLHQIRRYAPALILTLLWFLLTPLVAFSSLLPVPFLPRFLIAMLPAGALLLAYGVRWMARAQGLVIHGRGGSRTAPTGHKRSFYASESILLPLERGRRRSWRAMPLHYLLTTLFLCWLAYTQLTVYPYIWPEKPRWDDAIRQTVATRGALEPAISDIDPRGVVAYYTRQMPLRAGITLDLSWREFLPEETRDLVTRLAGSPSVWAILRSDRPVGWDVLMALAEDRGVGYRDTVMNAIFYRFDQGGGDELQFRFGDLLRYESGIGHQFYARAGESFCLPVELQLAVLQPTDAGYTLELILTQGYNTVRAAWSGVLVAHDSGETIPVAPCIDIPADSPRSSYPLRMMILTPDGGTPLPLIEGPETSRLYWGRQLTLGVVAVDAP